MVPFPLYLPATPPQSPNSQNALAFSQSGKLGPLGQEGSSRPSPEAPLTLTTHVNGEGEREGREYLHILKNKITHSFPHSFTNPSHSNPHLFPSSSSFSPSPLISCLSFINNSARYTLLNFTLIHLPPLLVVINTHPILDNHPDFTTPATLPLQTISQECAARLLFLSNTTNAEPNALWTERQHMAEICCLHPRIHGRLPPTAA